MASDRAAGGEKAVRSIHAVFARAGTYTKPIELDVDGMHAGRTWASDTVTATQDGRLLCRAIVLLNTHDPDLMRHDPSMPLGFPTPDQVAAAPGQVFPGAELRPIPDERTIDGVPGELAWHRFPDKLASEAANQAVVVWATCGTIIGLAMRPHRDTVNIGEAHRTLSTGVIAHTVHFTDRIDASQWLLIATQADKAADGRVYGHGSVFTEDGSLVAAFHQDSMAKAAEAPLDFHRSM
ncbi:MAG: thioesterase family protein [Acidimicrobiaceae bacterium]|nr:thioesterase family protein [Acidimicrobiaceae bacterium]